MRTYLLAACLMSAAFAVPAFADDMMKCDDAAVMKAEDHAKMMSGETMTMAMKEVDMAKMAMKDGKAGDCSMHLGKAMMAK
jgi:hypothetical protein